MGKSVILLSWIVTVTMLSLVPVQAEDIELFPMADKVGHFIFYFIMTILIAWASRKDQVFIVVKAFVISALYGVLMEFLQDNIGTGRNFDIFDIIANINGAFNGALFYYFIKVKK